MPIKKKLSFSSADEYIALQTPKARAALKKLRQTIKKIVPEAEEVISYRMPAFRFHGILLWYAAHKNHYALYPFAKTIEVFKDKLKPYELSKGTIKFPLDKPVPQRLVTEIVKYRMKENLEKHHS